MAERIALVTALGQRHRTSSRALFVARRVSGLPRRQTAVGAGRDTYAGRVTVGARFIAPADVSDPESVAGLFRDVRSRAGRLDVVFNNAGTGAPAVDFDDLSFEQWSKVIAVNLTGTFLVAQSAFRLMREQQPKGGRIINNGSVSAHVPRPNSAPYTATKHAITGLTRSISLDGRAHDIACGQIDIGNAETEMGSGTANGARQANGTMAPEPMFDPRHVGDAISYMAGLPLNANVQFITVMATKMPYIGRG